MEDIEAAVKEGRAGAKGANKDPRFRRVPKPEQVRVVWHVGQRGFGFGVGCGRLCMRTYTQVPCREGLIEPTPSISQYHLKKKKKCKPQVIVKEYKEERKSIFNLFAKPKRASVCCVCVWVERGLRKKGKRVGSAGWRVG